MSERHRLRLQFWTELLTIAKGKTKLHANRAPNTSNWIGTPLKVGVSLNYVTTEEESRVEVYIDGGKSKTQNLAVLAQLRKFSDEIDKAMGGTVEWQELFGKRACRICRVFDGGYRSPRDKWPPLQNQLIEVMVKLEEVIRDHLKEITFEDV